MTFSQAQSRGRLLRFLVDNLGQEITSGSFAGAGSFLAVNANDELVLANVDTAALVNDVFIPIDASNAYSTSSIRIGDALTPSYELDVNGDCRITGHTYLGNTYVDVVTIASQLTASEGGYFGNRVGIGTAAPANTLDVVGTVGITSGLYVADAGIIHTGDPDTTITFGANTQIYTCAGNERIKMNSTGVGLMGATPIAGVAVTGDITATGDLTAVDIDASGDLTAVNLNVATDIIHVGDTTTKITFGTGTQIYTCGASERIKMNSTGVGLMGATPIAGAAITGDLTVSADTTLGDAAADVTTVTSQLTASEGAYFADRVGIGDSTPTYTLDVNGDINIADNQYLRIGTNAVAHYTSNQVTIGSAATSKTLAFNCGNSSHAPSDTDPAMFIDATGSVGIGATTAPNSVLHIRSEHNPMIKVDPGTNTTVDPALWLMDTTAGAGFKLWYDNNIGSTYLDNYYDNANGDIFIRTKVAGTPVNAVTIDAAGSVSTAGAITAGSYAQLSSNGTSTLVGNAAGGYIDLKSDSSTYGVIIRDNNSTNWTNLNSANGYFQIAYMHTNLYNGIFVTEPSTDVSRVGINDPSPSYALDVNGTIRAQGAASDIISTDNLYAMGMNTTISGEFDCRYDTGNGRLEYVSSTRKIKNNIEYVTTGHLDNILSLRPATYELKANPGKLVLGLIAEDSFDVDPLLARLGPDYDYDEQGQVKRNIYTDDPSGVVQKEKVILSDNLVPLDWDPRAVTVSLVKAVQELKAENDALLLRVEQLEAV